jgi:hypothetical protein
VSVRARRAALAGLLLPPLVSASLSCGREDRTTPEKTRAAIEAIEMERETLRGRLDELMADDPLLEGMPDTPVRVGVPTSLARDLVQRLAAGFVDQITLEIGDIRVRKRGSVRRVVTIGDYELDVTVDRVKCRLETGTPEVTFGGDRISLALPVTLASGSGEATVRFRWRGRNISGAVCGDMDVTQKVTGRVRPARYPVSGSLRLAATATEIVAEPRFPRLRVRLRVEPSEESWGALQAILDDRTGVCGFVLDRVDVLGVVRRIVDEGFDVRLPTEKIRPVAVPVGIEPTMVVRGQPVVLGIRVGGLAITEHAIWLGAHVSVEIGEVGPHPIP